MRGAPDDEIALSRSSQQNHGGGGQNIIHTDEDIRVKITHNDAVERKRFSHFQAGHITSRQIEKLDIQKR